MKKGFVMPSISAESKAAYANRPFRSTLATVLTLLILGANTLAANAVISWGRQVLPPPEEMSLLLNISAGDDFNLALRTGGRVTAWGSNSYRQATIPQDLGQVISVEAGSNHALALQVDGTVVAWGNNSDGQTTIPEGLNDVVAISAGYAHNLALRADGTIVAWGSNAHGQTDIPENLGPVAAISAGRQHSLALLTDGTVVGWGLDSDGQATVPENLANVVAISAGGYHSLAHLRDGRLIAWGNNDFGQTEVPEQIGPIERIEAGIDHNLLLQRDGRIVAWGRNHYGQANVSADLPPVQRIAVGADHSIVLFQDGTYAAWGKNDYGQSLNLDDLESVIALSAWDNHTIALRDDGTAFWWGANLSAGVQPDPEELQNLIAVAAGRAHGIALRADGKVVTWGDNFYGQATTPSGLEDVVAITAGEFHNLAVRSDGTVVAWGSNFHGQLDVPRSLDEVIAVAAGREHSLALTVNGMIFAWGNDFHGQLRVPASLDDVVQIAAGNLHSLALRNDGTVVGWGSALFGKTSAPNGLSDVVDINASRSHSIAIRENRTLVGWGGNFYRQSDTPANLTGIIDAVSGNGRTAVVTGDIQAPRFISEFQSKSVPAGEDLFIMPRISGTPPLIFQWMKNGIPIQGARGPALSLENVGATDSASYSLIIANRAGNSTSQSFTVEVNDPFVETDIRPRIANLGQNVTLTAWAQGTEPFSYQWMRNGEPVENATQMIFVIENVRAEDSASYSVEVSNEHGTTVSEPIGLLIAPEIHRHPPPQTVAQIGERLVLEIDASGSDPLEIQWLREAIPLSGANSPQLVLENIDVEDSGIYSAVVSNPAGAIRSEATAVQILPHITFQPESQVFSAFGGTAVFDVRAIGTPPLTYRWMKDEQLLIETSEPRLVVDQVHGQDAGNYSVIVVNPAGQVRSEPASLVVPPFISVHPRSQTIVAGSDVEFTVQASGSNPVEYQWLKNGEPIPGETAPSLQIQNVTGNDSGRYTVQVANDVGSTVSQEALLSVSPSIITPPEGAVASAGSDVILFVEAEGTPPLYFQWTKNGNMLPEARTASLSLRGIGEGDTGTYSVIVSNSAGIAISDTVSVEVE